MVSPVTCFGDGCHGGRKEINPVEQPPNFGVKLMRPGFGPAAELPTLSPAGWRHGGCISPLGSSNVIGGNRRAASASARGTGRTAYTKAVRRTPIILSEGCTCEGPAGIAVVSA